MEEVWKCGGFFFLAETRSYGPSIVCGSSLAAIDIRHNRGIVACRLSLRHNSLECAHNGKIPSE